MSIKTIIFRLSCELGLILCLVVSAAAISQGKPFSGGVDGDYAPNSGDFWVDYWPTYSRSRLTFKYSIPDTRTITLYSWEDPPKYPSVDVKSVNQQGGANDSFHAYSIITDLPSPITDLENNWGSSGNNNEAEVTALGRLTANKTYSMTTCWEDKRSGNAEDKGSWVVNAELSVKSITGEYNVFDNQYRHLVSDTYTENRGDI